VLVSQNSEKSSLFCARDVDRVGPATQEVDVLEKMMQAGMSVVRMNFSHGSYEVNLHRVTCMIPAQLKLN